MEKAPMKNPPRQRRILLADDEARFVTQMARLLEARNFQVMTAGNGRDALALIETHPFDAVVLDIRMPVMDGMAALEKIKAKTPSPAVIMLTGHASLDTGIEALRRGAFDYLMKPCGIEDLVAKLDVACRVEQIRRRPILWPRSLAGELILEAFRRIMDSDPLLEAFSILNHRLPRMAGETLFIVDHGDRLVGHLSKQEILGCVTGGAAPPATTWEQLSANPQWLPDRSVGEVMKRDTVAVDPHVPLKTVAQIMIDNTYQTLPVIDNDRRVLGVIRFKDVLVYLENADAQGDEPIEESD
ncbi:response regulator [Desulfosarcina ovata]|uniref:Response regulator n=2 Tax=Desulfosarcina ovata TaxID=83564 RepID=A0A5K8ADA9_9BACT|nr:response regulator [Desulfosarcina ovata]BBO84071.1 hypothetical protein DSCO28_46370 [Desulfosarcina ovata subsp. sediminis]BBO90551.1 hypothetical protein DSCOOX_37310 [Desulfosarcina ovata subsp. ovata]